MKMFQCERKINVSRFVNDNDLLTTRTIKPSYAYVRAQHANDIVTCEFVEYAQSKNINVDVVHCEFDEFDVLNASYANACYIINYRATSRVDDDDGEL